LLKHSRVAFRNVGKRREWRMPSPVEGQVVNSSVSIFVGIRRRFKRLALSRRLALGHGRFLLALHLLYDAGLIVIDPFRDELLGLFIKDVERSHFNAHGIP
jgi:hypothetical protein